MLLEGKAREVAGYQEGFGAVLTEPDPERTIEVRGEQVHPHRHGLYRSGFEKEYEPRTAEQSATARERRHQKELEAEAEGSLFSDLILAEGWVPKKRKGRGPG